MRGALLGLAWGDALGCPIEYWTKYEIEQAYGAYAELPVAYPFERISDDPRVRNHLRPLGLHSDDTQQALTLVHACTHPGGWNLNWWTQLLVQGDKARAWRGTGKNFRSAVKNFALGVDPLQAGEGSAGIGAAMRVAPLGALYAAARDELANVIFESAYATHADIRAASLAYAVAACCAALVSGEQTERVRLALPGLVQEWESKAAARLSVLKAAPVDHVHAVSSALKTYLLGSWASLAAMQTELHSSATSLGVDLRGMSPATNHPFVLLGGVHAVCVGLWPGDDPAKLLSAALAEGGDADTVGAITGGILGARFGDGWIPVHRLIDGQALSTYANTLLHRRVPESVDAFLAREAAHTKYERRFVAELNAHAARLAPGDRAAADE